MAQSLTYVTSALDGLHCCVCAELFVDPHMPKDLHCPHVICEVCLTRLVKNGAIDCPECRLITRVPEKGVAALKTNLGIRNRAETHQQHEQKRMGTITIEQGRQPVARKRNTVGLERKIHLPESTFFGVFSHTIWSIASNRAGDILAISVTTHDMSPKNTVHIYCKQPNGQYKQQLSLYVSGPKFVRSHHVCVAIAADEKYLVATGRCIHVYSQSGQYQRVCCTAPEGVNVACIRTMKDGRIIAGFIAGKLAGDHGQNGITLHTPDGMTLMKTINTSIKPESITAINNTHVAICNIADNVCVIDLESGAETLGIDIDSAVSVCYDEETDCLLIAHGPGQPTSDLRQCVLDQYSLSTGFKIACIATNLYWPWAMIFTGDGRLAINGHDTAILYTVGFER